MGKWLTKNTNNRSLLVNKYFKLRNDFFPFDSSVMYQQNLKYVKSHVRMEAYLREDI